MKFKILQDTFYNRRVLLTGHTGFKGAWLSLILYKLGAHVYGYALGPPTRPSLFEEARLDQIVNSNIGDIRNLKKLIKVFQNIKPEIVVHMAAQPLVLESYKNPVETYETNIMGTVNLFEAVRKTKSVKVVVNVTSDKCYENNEWLRGYNENDNLGGYDPYSNSKACAELVTNAYRNSFFNINEFDKHGVAIASARAGNVIGGGDFAPNRIIPDFIKSVINKEQLLIRSPFAIRPWQHVLEPLTGYLLLAVKLLNNGTEFTGPWNFGPLDSDTKNVEWIVEKICKMWGQEASYRIADNNHPHEAGLLKLDCTKAMNKLGWYPQWNVENALKAVVDWHKKRNAGEDVRQITLNQINSFYNL